MPTTPRGPRLLKGAIVTIDLATPGASPQTIAFQYNPHEVTRSLTSQLEGGQDQRSEGVRFKGAPEESFTLKIEIDADDAMERGDSRVAESGIYPQLAALEMLAYPQTKQVEDANRELAQGKLQIGGPSYEAPLALFVWGPKRVLPVTVTSLSITETLFDSRLNPIAAEVTLQLRALSYSNLDPEHKGYSLFMAYQKGKEQLAKQGLAGNADSLVGFNVRGRIG
jgi:hypothetical protein